MHLGVPGGSQHLGCGDQDRNIATYVAMYNYTTDVIYQKDDGNYGGAAFADELQLKYFVDYFATAQQTH